MPEPPPPPRRGPTPSDTPTQLVAADDAPRQKVGDVVAGKYQLVRLIARGGMGTVWEALDRELERSVAIKFMTPAIAADAGSRQRFSREAKAAARLRTPHVVRIYEHGVDGDVPFIVMELLHGVDLHTRLKRERRIPLEEAARILAQMAKGLRVAHEAGIVHRDLKPQNVFLADEDGDLFVKILDFGVAKVLDQRGEGTKTGTLLGSPHYMSPEQARGKSDIDQRSDVWSLAAIAFRMVTGQMTFSGEGTGDVIIDICTGELPIPSKVAPDLQPPIDAFFSRGLQRDRDQRFPSAVALASAFAAAVRACSDASLLTPPRGHPLRPGSNDPSQPGTPPPATTPLPEPAVLYTPATGPSMYGLAGDSLPSISPQRRRTKRVAIAGLAIVGCVAAALALDVGGSGDAPGEPLSGASRPSEVVDGRARATPSKQGTAEGPSDAPAASATASASAEPDAEPDAPPPAAPPPPPVVAPTPKRPTPSKPTAPKESEWDSFGY